MEKISLYITEEFIYSDKTIKNLEKTYNEFHSIYNGKVIPVHLLLNEFLDKRIIRSMNENIQENYNFIKEPHFCKKLDLVNILSNFDDYEIVGISTTPKLENALNTQLDNIPVITVEQPEQEKILKFIAENNRFKFIRLVPSEMSQYWNILHQKINSKTWKAINNISESMLQLEIINSNTNALKKLYEKTKNQEYLLMIKELVIEQAVLIRNLQK